MRSADVHSIIGRIYDAALNQSLWPKILADLVDFSGADAAHCFVLDGKNGASPWGIIGRSDPASHLEYIKDYAAVDKRAPRFMQSPDYEQWTNQSLLTAEEIQTCPVHNEFLRKHNVFHLMGATISNMPGGSLIHAALRNEEKGQFQQDEIDRWLLFLPHIQRSVQMLRRFEKMEEEKSLLFDPLNNLNIGIVGLDSNAQLLFVNRYMSDVLSDNDGLFSGHNQLHARRSQENSDLFKMLDSCKSLMANDSNCASRTLHKGHDLR